MRRVRLRHLSFPVAFLLPILLVASVQTDSPSGATRVRAALVPNYREPSPEIERALAAQRRQMIDEAALLAEHNEKERLQVIADAAAAAAIEATKAQEAADAQAAAEVAEAARAAKVKAAAVRTTATTVARTFTSPTYTAPARSSSGIGEAIAECESGGSYTAANPSSTASGKYQFLDSTWDGYGGYARAKDAPPAVQEAAFADLYASQGTTPWNASRHCWG